MDYDTRHQCLSLSGQSNWLSCLSGHRSLYCPCRFLSQKGPLTTLLLCPFFTTEIDCRISDWKDPGHKKLFFKLESKNDKNLEFFWERKEKAVPPQLTILAAFLVAKTGYTNTKHSSKYKILYKKVRMWNYGNEKVLSGIWNRENKKENAVMASWKSAIHDKNMSLRDSEDFENKIYYKF